MVQRERWSHITKMSSKRESIVTLFLPLSYTSVEARVVIKNCEYNYPFSIYNQHQHHIKIYQPYSQPTTQRASERILTTNLFFFYSNSVIIVLVIITEKNHHPSTITTTNHPSSQLI